MNNTRYISASAGSGKTYTLMQEMSKQIADGKIHGNQVIMTTFTQKAAAELKEKARKQLESQGLFSESVLLSNAAIDTIHSVAHRFLRKYWYLAGVSADTQIADDTLRNKYINESLVQSVTDEDILYFNELRNYFNFTRRNEYNKQIPDYDFWQNHLRTIIDKQHCFQVDDLDECCRKSVEFIDEFYSSPVTGASPTKDKLLGNANTCLSNLSNTKRDSSKKMEQINAAILQYNHSNGSLSDKINFIIAVNKILSGAQFTIDACSAEIDWLNLALDSTICSDEVRTHLKEYVKKIFAIAKQWKKQYEAYKQSRCMLDFNDLERLFYNLLNNPEVEQDIRSDYKSLFVDEFQDCSPLQVKIFEKLGEMMDSVTYVGDKKQAIYAFRGTDMQVVDNVTAQFPKVFDKPDVHGNVISTLKESWRSTETLVNLANDVFEKAFDRVIDAKFVHLDKAPKGCSLPDLAPEHWHFNVENKTDFGHELALRIRELLNTRELKYNELAILYRNSADACTLISELLKLGCPVNANVDNAPSSHDARTIELANALVSLLIHPTDAYAQAVVLLHSKFDPATRKGYPIAELLSDRIAEMQTPDDERKTVLWNEEKIIQTITKLRETIRWQSVSAAVESILNEFGIKEILMNSDNATANMLAIDGYIATAKNYELQCQSQGVGASLPGFLTYVANNGIASLNDEKGIFVGTYHRSKGLEWKAVICAQMEKDPGKDDLGRDFFNVQTYRNTAGKLGIYLLPKIHEAAVKMLSSKIQANGTYIDNRESRLAEEKRLMYVGITRAKQLLILPTYNVRGGGMFCWLDALTDRSRDNGNQCPFKFLSEDIFEHKSFDKDSLSYPLPAPSTTFQRLKKHEPGTERAPKYLSPSSIEDNNLVTSTTVQVVKQWGEYLSPAHTDTYNRYGNFFHHLLFCWQLGDDNTALIQSLCKDYGLSIPAQSTDKVKDAVENFYRFMEERYGRFTALHREMPFKMNADGQVITGSIDLAYETADGIVLVDYKTCPRPVKELTDKSSRFYAGKYAPQLHCYRDALTRGGKQVKDVLLFYPVSGTVVEVKWG